MSSRPDFSEPPAPFGAFSSSMCWQLRLHQADLAEEVVTLARDFLAEWSPRELSFLQPDLRPRKIVDGDDVNDYALELVRQQQVSMDPRAAPQLHRMANFFSTASLRLSQLCAETAGSEARSAG